ncbi:MAG: hypothetical protein ACRD3O_00615 [Terriglobia bacterium]
MQLLSPQMDNPGCPQENAERRHEMREVDQKRDENRKAPIWQKRRTAIAEMAAHQALVLHAN